MKGRERNARGFFLPPFSKRTLDGNGIRCPTKRPVDPRRACRDPFIVGADRCDENMDGWSIVADFLLGLHRDIFAAKITLDDCVSRRNIEISICYTRCRDIENTSERVSSRIDFSDCDESVDPSEDGYCVTFAISLRSICVSEFNFFFFFLSSRIHLDSIILQNLKRWKSTDSE